MMFGLRSVESFQRVSDDCDGCLRWRDIPTQQHISLAFPNPTLSKAPESTDTPSHATTVSEFFHMTHHSDSDQSVNSMETSDSAIQSKDVDGESHNANASHPTKQSDDYSEVDRKSEFDGTSSTSHLENHDQSEVSELQNESHDNQNPVEEERDDIEDGRAIDELSTTNVFNNSDALSRTNIHPQETDSIPSTLIPTNRSDALNTNDIESAIQSNLQNVQEEAISNDDSESTKQELGDDDPTNDDTSTPNDDDNDGSTEQVISTKEEESEGNEMMDEVATISVYEKEKERERERERERQRKKRLKKRFRNRSIKTKKISPRTKTLLNYTFVEGYNDQKPYDLVLVTSVEMKGVGYISE